VVSCVTVCKYDMIVDLGITPFVDDGGSVVEHLSLSINVLIMTKSNLGNLKLVPDYVSLLISSRDILARYDNDSQEPITDLHTLCCVACAVAI